VPAPIVVEVYAPQPRPQELAVLISACTRAAAPNECITSDMRTSDSPLGVAIVRRDGDRARIELGLRGVVSAEWSTRDLQFQPGDDELERYRAIGFAIGTLVARQVEPPAPAPIKTTPAVPEPAAPAAPPAAPDKPAEPEPEPERRERSTWLDVSGSVGLGLIPGPPRAGGTLRAASEIVPGGTFAAAETGYSERIGEPSLKVRWLSLGLGVGHPLMSRASALGVDARLLIVVERLSLTAVDGERSDGAARWKPGVTAAVDAHWDVLPPLGLLVSAATLVDPERTVVRTQGTQVAETPALGFSGFVGVRLKLR
jgi:hypothetical protein